MSISTNNYFFFYSSRLCFNFKYLVSILERAAALGIGFHRLNGQMECHHWVWTHWVCEWKLMHDYIPQPSFYCTIDGQCGKKPETTKNHRSSTQTNRVAFAWQLPRGKRNKSKLTVTYILKKVRSMQRRTALHRYVMSLLVYGTRQPPVRFLNRRFLAGRKDSSAARHGALSQT